MFRKLLSCTVVLIFAISFVYFIYRFSDTNFLDNMMGNLFATMIGLIVGIPIGLEINRRQQTAIERKEKESNENKKRIEFRVLFDRLEEELQHNEEQLEVLNETFPLSAKARKDMWDLASAIVDSFSFRANDDFYSSGLHLFLPDNIEIHVYLSFTELRRLFHNIKTAVHAHIFYKDSSAAGENTANELFQKIKDDAKKVATLIDSTLDELAEYRATTEMLRSKNTTSQ